MPPTIRWAEDRVVIVDQTALPDEIRLIEISSPEEMEAAISRLAVRGAPALAIAGAFGVALAVLASERHALASTYVSTSARRLRSARPTAVTLAWGVDQVIALADQGSAAVIAAASELARLDVEANRRLAMRGAAWVREAVSDRPITIATHCNTGAFACVEWGTALGIIEVLHSTGEVEHVFVDETRPLLQGARLTAVELQGLRIPYSIIVDSAAPSLIARGRVGLVVVGADRIAANGDVVNKIGTLPLALAAARYGVPFVVAAPEATIDVAVATGADIEIEVRDPEEVLTFRGSRTAPEEAMAFNPAFDVTPADLVSVIVTEDRVVSPALGEVLMAT